MKSGKWVYRGIFPAPKAPEYSFDTLSTRYFDICSARGGQDSQLLARGGCDIVLEL